MTASLLVATPHAAFGELLRISLEESGLYQVRQVMSAKEAHACAARTQYKLAILDSDLTDESFTGLCYDLIGQMCIMIIPPDNDPNHPSLGGLIPHGYLNRPFYLPDLLDTVQRLVNPQEEQEQPPVAATPDWVGNPQILQNLLDQQLPGSEAAAILIGGQGGLLGNAGALDKDAANEMANILMRFWNPKEKTDLMRYMRLSSTKGDYLVYATEVVNDLVLIMVFEPSAQLSQVRPQTKQIAQNLLSITTPVPPPVTVDLPPEFSLVGSSNGHSDHPALHLSATDEPDTEPIEESDLDDEKYSLDDKRFIDSVRQPEQALDDSLEMLDSEDLIDEGHFDLSLLLGAIPSPDPGVSSDSAFGDRAGGGAPDLLSGWFSEEEWPELSATPTDRNPQSQPEEGPVVEIDSAQVSEGEQPPVESPATLAAEVPPVLSDLLPHDEDMTTRPILRRAPEETHSATVPMALFNEPAANPLEDTRPKVITTITNVTQLEPVSPALSLLNYTCVLLPRLPQHYLTGELADRLGQWVQQLCVAFGWRLEGISLRPEYLQWTVQVAPSVSPGNLVRIIRQRSSMHIFNTFEEIRQQNPSGDFWATGYLIVSGPQPPSAQLLREYIAQTRKRQGISKT